MKRMFYIILLLGISQGDSMQAHIQTTKGQIIVELEFDKTPMTVANFVGLAAGTLANNAKPLGAPSYDGINFHRVISDFISQDIDEILRSYWRLATADIEIVRSFGNLSMSSAIKSIRDWGIKRNSKYRHGRISRR